MAKNIVICSDGTGNRGGVGNETNVWRIYNAIDRRTGTGEREQIAHYDDGVGTDNNKYFKAFTGAFGWGFTENVKTAYKYLVTHYEPGDPENGEDPDDIYLFGFSRGAYTSRALAAFITTCGIIAYSKDKLDAELDDEIDILIKEYARRIDGKIETSIKTLGAKIKFIGVWDTVSAIGLPFDIAIERLILRFFKFKFKDQNLGDLVIRARHALAIDDQRRTFHPVLWNEKSSSCKDIEQVWFSGMHSNVGGGYPKQGMSYVALDWMAQEVECTMKKGEDGLRFEDGFEDHVRADANASAKMYNSRSGVAAYYRYTPRDISGLCKEHGLEQAKIHGSVFDRIDGRTESYNPGNLPIDLTITVTATKNDGDTPGRQSRVNSNNVKTKWAGALKSAPRLIDKRIILHLTFVLLNILFATALVHYLINRPVEATVGWRILNCETWHCFNLLKEFPFPAFSVFIILCIILNLKKIGGGFVKVAGSILCLVSIGAVYIGVSAPQGLIFEIWKVPDRIAGGLDYLLPDVLAEAMVHFLGHDLLFVMMFIVAFLVLLILRSCFRKNCEKVFEQACNLIRP